MSGHTDPQAVRDALLREVSPERDGLQSLTNALSHPPAGEVEAFAPTHRHVKRGSLYQVMDLGRFQGAGAWDDATVTIYRDAEGRTWVRPTQEFTDGRFAAIPSGKEGGS